MTLLSLDTNCLLRWLLGDVPEQTAQIDALLAKETRLDVADVALIETCFVLEKVLGLSRTTVVASLGMLAAQPALVFDRQLWELMTIDYLALPGLSAVDCYLAARASASGDGRLLAFDK